MCANFLKEKRLEQKHIKQVHYINGMHAIFVFNSLKKNSFKESMLRKYTKLMA